MRAQAPPGSAFREEFDGICILRRDAVNGLLVSIITGAFGMAYIVYGRRQTRLVPVVAGVLLCIYPYFIDSLLWLCLAGAVLLVSPFLTDF